MFPVIRKPKGKLQDYFACSWRSGLVASLSAQLAWSPLVSLPERAIKAPQASETRGQRNFSNRQVGFIQQAFRKVQAARLRNRNGRSAHVLREQTVQVARTDSQAIR